MLNTKLLSDICALSGAPGFEQNVRARVIEEVTPLVDEVQIDNMGNVYAIKKGTDDKRIMVAAHMDEIGFVVTSIDEDGYVRFSPLGGFDPKTLTAQRIIIHGKKEVFGVMGSKPIHIMKPEERTKVVPIDEYFIDTGMPLKEVEKNVSIGDPITRYSPMMEMGDCVNSKSLDNRVSVFILIETLKALKNKKIPYDLYGVFTVQEEIGLRGAINAAHNINPYFGFGLDVTVAFDTPTALPHEMITKLGEGTAIKVLDGSTVCDYRMVAYMKELAKKKKIKYQLEVLPKGGTDTAGVQRYGKTGAIAGAVSIPLRHIHQSIEMVNKSDVEGSIKLLTESIKSLDTYDWSFK